MAARRLPSYWMGADITDQETAPAAAQDNLLTQMKAHGFNAIRLRTFVDPKAADGYDKSERLRRHRPHDDLRQEDQRRRYRACWSTFT